MLTTPEFPRPPWPGIRFGLSVLPGATRTHGVVSKKHCSNEDLLARVHEYLPLDALLRQTDADGKAGAEAVAHALHPNTFYLFDSEALSSVCHAIEDLALEEANGNLLAAFQTFQNFEMHRERYGHMAVTVDSVEVLCAGRPGGRVRRVKFIKDAQSACREFRAVAYQGRHEQCLIIARQVNQAAALEDRQFVGFYTFSPWLIASTREGLLQLAAGRCASLREFSRQQAIDRAAKLIQREFSREKEAVDQAVRRWQLQGERYRTNHFAADLEKGLSRLHQWKARLPEILAQAERD